ncbi:hypothetical protein PBT90_20365 [Algoriphagus halophytocola]|uniref:hypothetical protein n=1 Tax=Algoriphagus halophytocola TaxID=2991499 RepID=UPI0022DE92A1|nr:hypothetical protein [Algoriphagus sp. TR-M9]WBL42405.1 hypothetical protein PBT90_16840 [Algoriphagus sp. TR-M9]WBL43084.1 hypothetical protein PBT90_20365 [Algoriphagus sp. TR-M9]
MDRSLSPNHKRLLKELEQLQARVVAKLERIKYEDGWEERKKKGHEIRMLVLDAIYNLELRRISKVGEAMDKLQAMGVKVPDR